MKLNYFHQHETALRASLEFYNIGFYRQINFFTIFFFFPGMLILVFLAWGFKSQWITGIGLFFIILFVLCLAVEILNRKRYEKLISTYLEYLKGESIHYVFDEEHFHYFDHLMDIKYKWSIFNGFLVYKGSIYLLPKHGTPFMYFISGENLKDKEFEDCINELSLYLEKLSLNDVRKKY